MAAVNFQVLHCQGLLIAQRFFWAEPQLFSSLSYLSLSQQRSSIEDAFLHQECLTSIRNLSNHDLYFILLLAVTEFQVQ